jgi:hypothetical protein
MRTLRHAGAAVVVELCGIAIAAGALLTWIDARGARPRSGISHTSIAGLFHWSYRTVAAFPRSFGMVVLIAGIGVLVGGLVGSRFLSGLFGLIALAAAGLWIALNATHYSPTALTYRDLQIGAWLTIGGAVIGQIGATLLRRSARA